MNRLGGDSNKINPLVIQMPLSSGFMIDMLVFSLFMHRACVTNSKLVTFRYR
jgi:hypothetical protein